MTKTLKDWPSNCEADFFDALPAAGSKTFFDFTKDEEPWYYARFHDPATHRSHVIPEVRLAGFLETLEEDFKTSVPVPFLGFYDDLEEIWWPEGEITPVPEGIVGVSEEHNGSEVFERARIVFYAIQKAPGGWLFLAEPGHFQVKPIREWILDYTRDRPETDPETPEPVSFAESVSSQNEVFEV